MPSNYKTTQYNEIFDKLPSPIKDTIANLDSAEKVYKIAQNHRLQIDQAGTLNQITIDVLMGITAAKDFLETVKKDLNIDHGEAISIVNDIDDAMFKPVREIMERSFHNEAPNKLRTINTADENDEEHLHLTKHDVLREIENPSPAERRRVESFEVRGGREEVKTVAEEELRGGREESEEKTPEISKTTEIEGYVQELTGNKIEIKTVASEEVRSAKKESVETPYQKNPVIMPSAPKTIAEMKLSSVTSVEKGNTIVEEKKEPTSQVGIKIDPYREPTN